MIAEQRIYVAVAGTIQVPVASIKHNDRWLPNLQKGLKTVIQPAGRQIAQACHVVSKLRHNTSLTDFVPITTIILQARDSNEMLHVYRLLVKRKLNPVIFSDDNPEYGPGSWPTAVAVFSTKKQVDGILDYLPLWSV
jgi:hypothetical protein